MTSMLLTQGSSLRRKYSRLCERACQNSPATEQTRKKTDTSLGVDLENQKITRRNINRVKSDGKDETMFARLGKFLSESLTHNRDHANDRFR